MRRVGATPASREMPKQALPRRGRRGCRSPSSVTIATGLLGICLTPPALHCPQYRQCRRASGSPAEILIDSTLRFLLTAGNVADCRATDVLLDDLAPRTIVLADKAYDSNAIRDLIERQVPCPTSPPRRTGAGKAASRARSTKGRNAVERMFYRLKAYRHPIRQTRHQRSRSIYLVAATTSRGYRRVR